MEATTDPSAATQGEARLPLQYVAEAFEQWEAEPGPESLAALSEAAVHLLEAHRVAAAELSLDAPPLPPLKLTLGIRGRHGSGHNAWEHRDDVHRFELSADRGRVRLGGACLQGALPDCIEAARALEIALDLTWSRATAREAAARFDALDAATAAIAAEPALNRVLQLIVDRVRPLVGADYAALGIFDPQGHIERFITSGIDHETRAAIGPLPRGHGLLGVIVEENRSVRTRDVMTDPRRHGFPPNHPPMHSFLGVPVTVDGTSVGNLYLTKREIVDFTEQDQRVVETFARHATIAIDNARLHETVQRMAVLSERQRISEDLHDGIIQSLYAVGLSLEDMGDFIDTDAPEVDVRIERAIDSIHGIIRDIRKFIMGLRPESFEGSDLSGGLAALVEEFRRSTLIAVELETDEGAQLPADETMQVLQLAREALSNVARHAGATLVQVVLGANEGGVELSIADNGHGFDAAVTTPAGHHGLGNMRRRAESLRGSLIIDSGAEGTRITIQLPSVVEQFSTEASS